MRRYLSEVSNWPSGGLMALAGYALALGSWQVARGEVLADYVFANKLDPAVRVGLAVWLVAGTLAGLGAWLLGIALLTRAASDVAASRVHALARGALVLVALPLLSVLALPEIQSRAPLLTLVLIGIATALVGSSAGRIVLHRLAQAPEPPVTPHASSSTGLSAAAVSPLPVQRRRTDNVLILVLLLAAGYALFMGFLTVSRHNSFETHAFDLGIQAQAMWSIVRHGIPWTTLYGTQVINQFGDHFSPIYYLFTPLYAAWPDARTLLILQSVWLATGAVPVYRLARRRLSSASVAVALSASYLLFPGLHAVNLFDFHEIALVTPLLLAALYLLDAERYGLGSLFLGLALLCKEEVSLTGVAIGLYILLVHRRVRVGIVIAAASFIYFLVVTYLVMPALGGGADVSRFTGMTAEPWTGFGGVMVTTWTNPIFTLSYALLDPEKALFLVQLLLPLLALPLLAPIGSWLVAAPGLATLLLSSYASQYSLDAHYPAIVIPSAFFLTVLAIARIQRRSRAAIHALTAALLVASLLMNQQYGLLLGKRFDGFPRPGQRDVMVASVIAQIPSGASAATYSDYVPHLASRDRIYLLPNVVGAEYILFDTAPGTNYFPLISRDPRGEAIGRIYPDVESGAYGVVTLEDGLMLLRRHHSIALNDAALAALGSVTYDAALLPGGEGSANQPDPEARSGQARVSPAGLAPGSAETLRPVFGPYATLIPGRYRVDYRLKTAGAQAGQVALVDVFSFTAGGVIAQEEVTAEEFEAAERYKTFSLDIRSDKLLQDVEFRVSHIGSAPLSVDTVSAIYLGRP